jgi:hypothetical protein
MVAWPSADFGKAIVTHNRRDFAGVEKLNLGVRSPAEFLRQIGVRR